MRIIDINTSVPYKVLTGEGLLKNTGGLVREYAGINKNAGTAALISDDIVAPLYEKEAEDSLREAGFSVISHVFKNGEESKNLRCYSEILEFLAENHLTRADFIVALGGGVTGDMAGFAAATYLRGIDFIQIPTTLLAAVDSSVGGKTAVDLSSGKNLVGAFHQPGLVVCDLNTFNTLSDEIFTAGCAEVIKYGVLGDAKLFSHLEKYRKDFDREYVVSRCVELKRDIVVKDEFDNGERRILNLGHTLGHAVEIKSGFGLVHGFAVAIGLAAVTRAAEACGICAASDAERIISLLKDFGLPTETGFSMDELFDTMKSDKKRQGDSIALVIPEEIGKCVIRNMNLDEMRSFLEQGL